MCDCSTGRKWKSRTPIMASSKYAKYLTSIVDVITRAVKTTYQTYVETLKNKDMFTAEAQKEALSREREEWRCLSLLGLQEMDRNELR